VIVNIAAGIVTGFLVSIPPLGPIAFTMISKGFKNEVKEGRAIAFGAAFMDGFYSFIAFSGIALLISFFPSGVGKFYARHSESIVVGLTFVGCVIVFLYGMKIIRMRTTFTKLEAELTPKLDSALAKAVTTMSPEQVIDEVKVSGLRGRGGGGFPAGVKWESCRRAKGDIKYDPARRQAFVGEIAARLSGGYMSGWTYPYASGIEPTREALLAAVGLEPDPAPADRGWVSAERAFISVPGRVAAVLGSLSAERRPYVKNLFLRVAPGDRVVFPANNVEKCGNVISQAPGRAEAVGAAEEAVRGILIRLAPRDEATESFLRGEGRAANPDGGSWPPEAFPLPPGAVAELEAMGDPRPGGLEGGGRPASAGHAAIAVLSLDSADSVAGADWAGRGFAESAALALDLGGARILGRGERPAAGERLLGARFWRALSKGGAQAGLYVLDSSRAGDR